MPLSRYGIQSEGTRHEGLACKRQITYCARSLNARRSPKSLERFLIKAALSAAVVVRRSVQRYIEGDCVCRIETEVRFEQTQEIVPSRANLPPTSV